MPDPNAVERCDYIHAHDEIVNQVNENMPDEEILYDLAVQNGLYILCSSLLALASILSIDGITTLRDQAGV